MDIGSFSAIIGQNGVARSSDFMVNITKPKKLNFNVPSDLRARIDTINIPGRTIQSFEYKSYGPAYKIGYNDLYGDCQINIMLSPNFREKQFFQRWQDLIVGFGRSSTNFEQPGAFDIGYYHDYIGTVDIFQYNKLGQRVYSCALVDAWPISITDLPADWSTDGIHRLGVSFCYRLFNDDTSGDQQIAASQANYGDGVVTNSEAPFDDAAQQALVNGAAAAAGQLQQDTSMIQQ